jgi:hypothetical protein
MRTFVLLVVILAFFAVDSRADVDVIRVGDENPVLTIAKATFWGGVTGLLIGGALALVVDDNQEDYIKWGLVGGIVGGCAFGVYHVMSRPSGESSLLETDGDSLALNFPTVNIAWTGNEDNRHLNTRMTVFSCSF